MENGKKVYLEIHNTYILLVVLDKNRDEYSLNSQTTQIVPLDNLEFDDGIVNNPTVISRFIKNYIETHNLINPEAIICLRNADKTRKDYEEFMILQVALLVAKTGMMVSKIVHGPIMPWNNTTMLKGKIPKKELKKKNNLFQVLVPPSYTNPHSWVLLSAVLMVCCSGFIISQHTTKRSEIHELQNTLDTLKQHEEDLSKKTKDISRLKDSNNEKLSKIQSMDDSSENVYGDLLRVFSESMPKNSWLKSLKKSSDQLVVTGNTLDSKEIPPLLKKLEGNKMLNNITLKGIRMNKKGQTKLYTFTISGEISV